MISSTKQQKAVNWNLADVSTREAEDLALATHENMICALFSRHCDHIANRLGLADGVHDAEQIAEMRKLIVTVAKGTYFDGIATDIFRLNKLADVTEVFTAHKLQGMYL